MNDDEKWMKIAIKEAIKAEKNGEVPIGAVLVKNGIVIAKSHNQPISKNDATAHAEIQVIRLAGKAMQNYRLVGTTLYVTLEPCIMCLGAIRNARVSRTVFGAYSNKNEDCQPNLNLINTTNIEFITNKLNIDGGVLEKDCKRQLKLFFTSKR